MEEREKLLLLDLSDEKSVDLFVFLSYCFVSSFTLTSRLSTNVRFRVMIR